MDALHPAWNVLSVHEEVDVDFLRPEVFDRVDLFVRVVRIVARVILRIGVVHGAVWRRKVSRTLRAPVAVRPVVGSPAQVVAGVTARWLDSLGGDSFIGV